MKGLSLSSIVIAIASLNQCVQGTPVEPRAAQACDCQHNGDAGRWNDPLKPSDRLATLCGGGCWQSNAGRMCVTGDSGQCDCAVQSARDWESWSGDWFLWSSIQCGGLTVTIT